MDHDRENVAYKSQAMEEMLLSDSSEGKGRTLKVSIVFGVFWV